jgi:hypothetical protein
MQETLPSGNLLWVRKQNKVHANRLERPRKESKNKARIGLRRGRPQFFQTENNDDRGRVSPENNRHGNDRKETNRHGKEMPKELTLVPPKAM